MLLQALLVFALLNRALAAGSWAAVGEKNVAAVLRCNDTSPLPPLPPLPFMPSTPTRIRGCGFADQWQSRAFLGCFLEDDRYRPFEGGREFVQEFVASLTTEDPVVVGGSGGIYLHSPERFIALNGNERPNDLDLFVKPLPGAKPYIWDEVDEVEGETRRRIISFLYPGNTWIDDFATTRFAGVKLLPAHDGKASIPYLADGYAGQKPEEKDMVCCRMLQEQYDGPVKANGLDSKYAKTAQQTKLFVDVGDSEQPQQKFLELDVHYDLFRAGEYEAIGEPPVNVFTKETLLTKCCDHKESKRAKDILLLGELLGYDQDSEQTDGQSMIDLASKVCDRHRRKDRHRHPHRHRQGNHGDAGSASSKGSMLTRSARSSPRAEGPLRWLFKAV